MLVVLLSVPQRRSGPPERWRAKSTETLLPEEEGWRSFIIVDVGGNQQRAGSNYDCIQRRWRWGWGRGSGVRISTCGHHMSDIKSPE